MAGTLPPLSLYLHLPWCVRKCPYCDFNSHRAGDSADFGRYVAALINDIRAEGRRAADRTVESIFLGGGTPSLFRPERIASILDACRSDLSLATNCEITMEANPGTVEHGSLEGYRKAGVNRLSIGAQSFDAAMLKTLGRIHGPDEIKSAFDEAVAAGFADINVDLMFALPGQGLDAAAADVEELIGLSPQHVSYYQLTLEPNTVFHRQPPAGIPDDELAWTIQEQGHRMLRDAGFVQYEISAFAKPGHRCRHNLNYWQFGDYLAAGAGGHGKVTDESGRTIRYRKPANPLQYMEQAESGDLVGEDETMDATNLGFEFMLNALRLSEGFSDELLAARAGGDPGLDEKILLAEKDGLLERTGRRSWRPTTTGFRFLNDLQARFLP